MTQGVAAGAVEVALISSPQVALGLFPLPEYRHPEGRLVLDDW